MKHSGMKDSLDSWFIWSLFEFIFDGANENKMAFLNLYESLCNRLQFNDHIPELSDDQKNWLTETINNSFDQKGKNNLIAISMIFNKQANSKYFPSDQLFDLNQLNPYLQWLWFEFAKLHIKAKQDDDERDVHFVMPNETSLF